MQSSVELFIEGASPAAVFAHVDVLDRYPPWMRLVHRVEPLPPDDGRLAWWVELRARVGPFARSKQLRMVRTTVEPARFVRFERIQPDERDHANWILEVALAPAAGGTDVTTRLDYTGSLWTGGVLAHVLDDEIRRGRESLHRVVTVGGVS
ncbi:MAG: SRPBCC family protein [Actinomycetota bacterium]|nr:SRPBCC family protein [Actinomycetota bacterium]